MSNNEATIALLEKHFDIAFAAPDGIKKLRELILSLAMQGKLVPQDPSDQPASELLKEIEAEKKRLVKEGKIKQSKPLPEVKPDEVPYELPKGWQWVRLGTVGNIFNGNSIKADIKESKYAGGIKGLPYIATKDVSYGLKPLDYENGISIPEQEKKFKIAHKGAILICAEGGSAGKKCGITDRDICFGNKLFANEVFSTIHSKFILFIYLTPFFNKLFAKSMTGIIGGVSIAKFVEILIPLPPLAEQSRIVAKIDELMARCDELEKLRDERNRKQITVHTSGLNRLLFAKEQSEFYSAWQFITQHFSELYSVKENVAELRKAILQLAVMGKLVPQDPNDQPASELLKEIEKEKQRLVKEGKIKKSKPLPEIKPDEVPYELPKGWEWVFLSSIVESIDYGTSQKTVDDSTLIPVYRMGNIVEGNLVNVNFKYINENIEDLPKLYLKKMDILFNRTNSYELVGKSAIYLDDDNKATFASYLIRVRLIKKEIMPSYIIQAMNSAYFRKTQIEPEIVQQCGQANFNGSKLSLCLFPLPPLAEQQRIVDKIYQLMVLCDNLETQIDNANSKQTNLLNSVMAKI